MKLFAIVIFAVALKLAIAQVNYCNIPSCFDRSAHTLCRYPTPGPSTTRCTGLISSGLTTDEKTRILNTHNQLRQRVASGNEPRGNPGPQPRARSMPNLVWNDEIATIAQRWADQCTKAVDSCRDTQQYYVNQNFVYSGTTGSIANIQVESLVQNMYSQVDASNKAAIDVFTGRGANNVAIGSFTQVVWADTTNLGCGAVRYRDGSYNTLLLVCNYGPGGNILGDSVYQTIS